VLYLLVVTDSPHAPTVNIDNTTARTLDDSLPGQLVNPRSRPSTGRLHDKPSGAVNSAGVAGAGGHALVRMSQLALRAGPYRGRTSNLWLNPAAGAGPRTQPPRRGSNLRDQDRGHDALTPRVLIQRLLNATLGGRNLGLDIVERRFGQLGDPLCGCGCVEARGTAGG
jgi:hypothetical protein